MNEQKSSSSRRDWAQMISEYVSILSGSRVCFSFLAKPPMTVRGLRKRCAYSPRAFWRVRLFTSAISSLRWSRLRSVELLQVSRCSRSRGEKPIPLGGTLSRTISHRTSFLPMGTIATDWMFLLLMWPDM